ncbi:hypothetical protein ACB376_09295 [Klebsiella electrica]
MSRIRCDVLAARWLTPLPDRWHARSYPLLSLAVLLAISLWDSRAAICRHVSRYIAANLPVFPLFLLPFVRCAGESFSCHLA